MPALSRHVSTNTDSGMSAFSFESLSYEEQSGDESFSVAGGEEGKKVGCGSIDTARGCTSRSCAAYVPRGAPSVEDVLMWTGIVDGLKRFPSETIKVQGAGQWDGAEGCVQLAFQAPDGFLWE